VGDGVVRIDNGDPAVGRRELTFSVEGGRDGRTGEFVPTPVDVFGGDEGEEEERFFRLAGRRRKVATSVMVVVVVMMMLVLRGRSSSTNY
jgi:hypothetical protein